VEIQLRALNSPGVIAQAVSLVAGSAVLPILFSVETGGKCSVSDYSVELVWVELFANPLALFGMFRMTAIGQNFQQM
jgi:hypothetical protein